MTLLTRMSTFFFLFVSLLLCSLLSDIHCQCYIDTSFGLFVCSKKILLDKKRKKKRKEKKKSSIIISRARAVRITSCNSRVESLSHEASHVESETHPVLHLSIYPSIHPSIYPTTPFFLFFFPFRFLSLSLYHFIFHPFSSEFNLIFSISKLLTCD